MYVFTCYVYMYHGCAGGLLSLHVFLILRGQTTSEYLKGESRRVKAGLGRKCFLLWLGHIPNSLLPRMHEFPSKEDVELNARYATATIESLSSEREQQVTELQ